MNPSVKVSSASGRSCPIAANTPSSSSGERASNERKVNPTLRAGSCVSSGNLRLDARIPQHRHTHSARNEAKVRQDLLA